MMVSERLSLIEYIVWEGHCDLIYLALDVGGVLDGRRLMDVAMEGGSREMIGIVHGVVCEGIRMEGNIEVGRLKMELEMINEYVRVQMRVLKKKCMKLEGVTGLMSGEVEELNGETGVLKSNMTELRKEMEELVISEL